MRERPSRSETPKFPPLEVITRTTSPRRTYFLRYFFPDALHRCQFGGPEPKIYDTVQISRGKIDFDRKSLPKPRTQPRISRLELSADTQTSTLSVNNSGTTFLETHGKPQNPQDVLTVFQKMRDASEISGMDPYYIVTSGSSAVISGPKRERAIIRDIVATQVYLDKEKVKELATPQGFTGYLEALNRFYSSPAYLEGLYKKSQITDISGGMSISTLTKLGIVTSIDSVPRQAEDFEDTFRRALFNATVGFSPIVLRNFEPQPTQKIDNWPWLHRVSQAALSR